MSLANESMSNQSTSSIPWATCQYVLRPLGYYFVFLWIVGTFLNGSVLLMLIGKKKKFCASSTNILIAGLIFADFIGAMLEIPMPAFSLINCKWIFSYSGCVLGAVVSYFAGCSNMYMLCLISIDRYSIVTKCGPAKVMTVKRTYTLIFFAYGIAILWTMMPLLGWSSYDYEGLGLSCSIKWEDRSFNVVSYNMTILIFVYLIPIITICITNIKIYLITRDRCSFAVIYASDRRVRQRYLAERRVLHTILFIIGGFVLAWTPYAFVVFLRVFMTGSSYPPIMSTLPALFAKTSVVWNPLIYVLRNSNFRRQNRRRHSHTHTRPQSC